MNLLLLLVVVVIDYLQNPWAVSEIREVSNMLIEK